MTRTPRASRIVLATTVAVGLLASACTSSDQKSPPAAPSSPASSSTATSASSTPAPKPAAAAVNPLTGLAPKPTRPVVAVKIDDTAPGRPQLNVDKADVVYIEEAEGGLSRLVAVYASNHPTVGYVRSTRPSDPDLLLQYGKITEAASGGGHDALPLLDKSGIKGWINDRGAPYYSRVSRASDYINLVLDLDKVTKSIRTAKVRSIGWTFSASNAALPKGPGTNVRTRVGSTAVQFKWDPKLGRYVRYIDGSRQVAADGHPVAASNVIVQYCKVVPHPQDTDVNGNPSQFTITVGTGAVSVFRNGHRTNGTWSRKNVGSGTVLRTKAGKPLPLAPGKTWVVLVRNGVSTLG